MKPIVGNSLVVQWLGLHASTAGAGAMGLIPGLGTKIPQALWHGQKKKTYPEGSETTFCRKGFQVKQINE